MGWRKSVYVTINMWPMLKARRAQDTLRSVGYVDREKAGEPRSITSSLQTSIFSFMIVRLVIPTRVK